MQHKENNQNISHAFPEKPFKRSDVELMAPVGSYESLMAAVQGGADSVYFGVEKLNMRSHSSYNFTLDDLDKIAAFCRENNLRSYLTVNTVLYDNDLPFMREVMDRAKSAGITAVIVSDQAGILYARKIDLEVHISTQLSVSNTESFAFYASFADVIVLARELNLEQVRHIFDEARERQITGPNGAPVKIEMFCHGALCMAVSGKCYLSLHDAAKSANRGECRQICRRAYVVTDKDTGAALAIENQYIMSPKDLCTIDFLDRMIAAGVRVLKIEGRARSAEYVKRVCECYNEALEALEDGTYSFAKTGQWKERLSTVFNRGFWDGYYLGRKSGEWSQAYGSSATKKKIYVGKITNYFKDIGIAEILVEAASLNTGEEVFISGETTGIVEFTVDEIRVDLKSVSTAVQQERCSVPVPGLVRRGDKLYKCVDA